VKNKIITLKNTTYTYSGKSHAGKEFWVITNGATQITGFNSLYGVLDLLHSLHGFCQECGAEFPTEEYLSDEYFDYAKNKNLTCKTVCPKCKSWN
jgi:hypothetical protein